MTKNNKNNDYYYDNRKDNYVIDFWRHNCND